MALTLTDWFLWAAGFLGHAALVFGLFRWGAWKVFPFFTSWVAFALVRSLALFALHSHGSPNLYAKVYWYGQIPELLLLLGVVWDLARALLRPGGRWVGGTKSVIIAGAAVAVVFAAGLTWAAQPAAPSSRWSLLIRGNLLSAVLISELALAVVVTARFFGLAWRHWVTGLAVGLMLWCGVTFAVEAAHSYFGYGELYRNLVHVRMYAELAALGVWIFSFSRPQPLKRPISPELMAALSRLEGSWPGR